MTDICLKINSFRMRLVHYLCFFILLLALESCQNDPPNKDYGLDPYEPGKHQEEGSTSTADDNTTILPSKDGTSFGSSGSGSSSSGGTKGATPDNPASDNTNPSVPLGGTDSSTGGAGAITAEDASRLYSSITFAPNVAYLEEETMFKNEMQQPALSKLWSWSWRVGSNSWENSNNGVEYRYTFREIGLQRIKIRAQAGNQSVEKDFTVLITISKDKLNKWLQEMVALAKTAGRTPNTSNWNALNEQMARFGAYLQNARIQLPRESVNFDEFKDIMITDVPHEDRFKQVVEYEYDKNSGKITRIKLQ